MCFKVNLNRNALAKNKNTSIFFPGLIGQLVRIFIYQFGAKLGFSEFVFNKSALSMINIFHFVQMDLIGKTY